MASLGTAVDFKPVVEWSWPWLVATGLITLAAVLIGQLVQSPIAVVVGLIGAGLSFYTGFRAAASVKRRLERQA